MMEKTFQKNKKPKNFFLTCDWLQLHVKHESDYLTHLNPFYTFKLVGQSKVFKQIYEIVDTSMNIVIGQYCTGASEAIMPGSEGVLKFENAQLYCHDDLKLFVISFLKKVRLRFIGITRFDVAMDFQEFENGLNPGNFIKQFIREKILAVKNVKFGCYGQQRGLNHEIGSLSFGSKKSNITYKLYNKTKELEISGKTWITKAHQINFDDDDKDVWRLEFSISSLNAFMKGEGKDFEFHNLKVLDFINMYGIYMGLFNNYFRFKIKKKERRKTRMENLKLWQFEMENLEIKLIKRNPMIKKNTRSEKIFVKKLDEFNKQFRLFDENFDWSAKDLIGKIVDMHSLQEWAVKKGIEFDGDKNYINNIFEFAQIKASSEKLETEYNIAIAMKNQYEFSRQTY